MRYIKFKTPVIKRLETYVKVIKGEEKEKLKEALANFKRKKNLVEEKYFDVLRNHDMYADNFIEYYLRSEEEEIQLVMFRREMLDYIYGKLERQPYTTQKIIKNALKYRQSDKYIPMKYLRKIEYILDVDLKRFFIKVGILDMSSEVKVLTDEEECKAMYDIARRLSIKYNIGYKLSYMDKSLDIEKYKLPLELHWDKCCVYDGKNMIANLLIGTEKATEKIVRYFYKKARIKDEII